MPVIVFDLRLRKISQLRPYTWKLNFCSRPPASTKLFWLISSSFLLPSAWFTALLTHWSLWMCVFVSEWPLFRKTWECHRIWRLSGKVRELTKIPEIVGEKILSGKIVYCWHHVSGNTGVYWHRICIIFLMMHFWHIAWHHSPSSEQSEWRR